MKAAAVLARLFFCLTFVAGGAIASAFAVDAEDYWPELKQKAEQGDAKAQFDLAHIYIYGRYGVGIASDHRKALKWLRLAAKQKHAFAQYYLGKAYYEGWDSLEKNYTEALKWLRLAAEKGNYFAQYDIGVMYEEGKGVTRNKMEALKWFRLATAKGSSIAPYHLGVIYEEGKGVEQDNKEAIKWFRIAAEQGNGEAQYRLGVMYEKGKGVAQNDRKAAKWYLLAANKWNFVALDKLESERIFSLVAELGDMEALYTLGTVYEENILLDKTKATKWYLLAAKRGHAKAQNRVGEIYLKGEGVVQNYRKAYIWFALAAANGDSDAPENRKRAEEKLTPDSLLLAQDEASELLESMQKQ